MTLPRHAGGSGTEPYLKTDICIIGAGPAGLMAAIYAAGQGAQTALLETHASVGRKLLATGGGRCNFTHASTVDELVRTFGKNGRFLRHSLHTLSPEGIQAFLAERGLAGRVEADGCVFPVTDSAADVRDILLREVEQRGVQILYRHQVTDVIAGPEGFTLGTSAAPVAAKRLIVATGGLSWPQTGSTGDGYRFASALGHTVVTPKASLVPLVTRERWPGTLAGVSLHCVKAWVASSGRKHAVGGPMVFTQDGIGGPTALDLSRTLTDALAASDDGVDVCLDLIPDVTEQDLDQRLQERFAAHPKKAVANILADLTPKRLAATLCAQVTNDREFHANRVTRDMRRRLTGLLKALPLRITKTHPIAEATVTRGGVSIEEIDPRTLESRICPGLFFAGEVIDVDGPCGGYSLQACWSTGALAGLSAARSLDTDGATAGSLRNS